MRPVLSRPVNKKAITVDILEKLVDLYGKNLQNVFAFYVQWVFQDFLDIVS
jgi:hypothetical protein